MEDLPTLLQRQYGLKPQGKGAPMSSSNKSPISNSNSNYNSNSTYEQPFPFTAAHNYDNNNNNFSYNSFDDDDMFGLFAKPQNQKPSFSSPTVDDMLGTFNYRSTTTTTTPVSGYVDVLFGGIGSANTTNAKTTTTSSSSSPFAVFEDDVFGMSTSSSSDNVFGMANKAPSFSPLDDLFGGDFSTNSFKPSNSKPKPKPASVSKAARGGLVPRPGPVFEVEDLIKDIGISNCSPSQGPIFEEVEGEPEERRRARWERYQRTKNRADQALREKTERDLQVQREQAERNSFAETLDLEVKRWAAGKEGNLRALLSTLQSILWPGAGWHSVSLMDVITSQAVKKVYKKAALCVHPDKMQQKGASIEQKYIAEKVFDLLKAAWNKFNSEEL